MRFLIQWKCSVGDVCVCVCVYIYIYIYKHIIMEWCFSVSRNHDIVSTKLPLCVVIVVIWIGKINS